MKLQELETPALVVDLDIMEKNLLRMQDYCSRHGLDLRPHIKTHKSPLLAMRQLDLGATGITVAKLGEAEVMVEAGFDDILIAYPVFGEFKARRLATLQERAHISVSLDSSDSLHWVAQAARSSRPMEVLVEVDFGMRRCGLPPGEEVLKLAREIEAQPGLKFGGLMFYSGHIHPDFDGTRRRLERLRDELMRQLELFRREGLSVPRVTGGNTPAAYYSHEVEGLTEIRPGTYIFNDRNTVSWKACQWHDCAAFLWVTVVSTAVPGQAIIDGGSKTFTSDPLITGPGGGHGFLPDYPEAEFARMNEEHGYLKQGGAESLELGQKVAVIPNHICVAVNLHDQVWGMRRGEIVEEWEVAARGRIR